jgi:hypothetical protein
VIVFSSGGLASTEEAVDVFLFLQRDLDESLSAEPSGIHAAAIIERLNG